jgi:predicted lipid-binding transport protein (Tim44 family)
MRKLGIVMAIVLATAAVVASDLADARRLGGARSFGVQRQSVAPRPAATPGAAAQPVMPTQPGAAAATPAPTTAGGASRWLGPLAGLAAGLGLGALLAHFGMPAGLGSVLLLALLAVAAILVVRALISRRAPPRPAIQYAGGAEPTMRSIAEAPDATPWGNPARREPVLGTGNAPIESRSLPPGFDAEGFARQAKIQFTRLQAAYDAGDRQAMAAVMTPEMYAEVCRDLASRGEHRATEVVALNAGVLEVATEGAHHWASVRYTGLVREDGEATPKPIDEVWNLTKPVDGSSGWLLAGIQQTA